MGDGISEGNFISINDSNVCRYAQRYSIWAMWLRIEVDRRRVGDDVGLARQDEAGVDLVRIEREVAPHPNLAGGDSRPARPAHASFAGEGEVGADSLSAVENGRAEWDLGRN